MGNYADPPARRLAWDADGTLVMDQQGASFGFWPTGSKQSLNNEDFGGPYDGNSTILGSRPGTVNMVFIFPALRDISHLYIATGSRTDTINSIQYSTDTTTGLDGTWTAVAWSNTGIQVDNAVGAWRKISVGAGGIKSWVAAGVRAIRLSVNYRDGNDSLAMLHIYGKRAAADPTRNVGFTTAAGVRFTKDADWADRPWGHAYKWKSPDLLNEPDELYVHNFDGSGTANAVVVSANQLTGQLATYTTFSLDDVTYTATVTIASIAPGATSGPIYVKWEPPVGSGLGVFAERLVATVGSWT